MVDSPLVEEQSPASDAVVRQSSFFSDVLKLVSGASIAQLIGLIAVPIITRLYSPDDLGLLTVLTSIVSIIVVISCMRYELAIVLPKTNA